jgi:hypothetical protein
MLDELAVKKCVCWEDLCNKFQGTCHEHNHQIPLDFTSEKELGICCDAIENDDVHLAMEVCFKGYERPAGSRTTMCKGEMSECNQAQELDK